MKNYKNTKIISIVALVISIICLSIGFAVYSSVLTIKSEAQVSPEEKTFMVKFSSSNEEFKTDKVHGISNPLGLEVSDAIINNDVASSSDFTSSIISGLSVNFTDQGQNVIYEFYAYNKGEYDAYLTEIIFNPISKSDGFVKCLADDIQRETFVKNACENLNIIVSVGNTSSSGSEANVLTTNKTNENIKGHRLLKGEYEKIKVEIRYEDKVSSPFSGKFSVDFGDIQLKYSAIDNTDL